MELRVDHLLEALPVIGEGMLGVFAVTLVIIGMVALLNRFTGREK